MQGSLTDLADCILDLLHEAHGPAQIVLRDPVGDLLKISLDIGGELDPHLLGTGRAGDGLILALQMSKHVFSRNARRGVLASLEPKFTKHFEPILLETAFVAPVAEGIAEDFA